MNKKLLALFCVAPFVSLQAQTTETVSTGAGYANQTWYSLENGEQGSVPKNNWDLAFDLSGFGTSVHINSVIGMQLWTYPTSDTTGWATVDTAGITTWTPMYNSDESWGLGAFDRNTVPSNQFDVGWGIYNPITHIITGDSIFVIKLASGAYKKIWIKNVAAGAYNFQYADLNGANLQVASLVKSNFIGKNFGYYSFATNATLDREPVASANWDLLFTQYTGFIPTPYAVAGVLSNKGVLVAQAIGVSNVSTYTDWSAETFEEAINTIGYDWKTFSGTWVLESDWVYFVQAKNGDIWKIVFTGFGGSGNGNFEFTKQKLSTSTIEENNGTNLSLAVYPNPINQNENITVAFNAGNSEKVAMEIIDITGKVVYTETLNNPSGLVAHSVSSNTLASGIYFVKMIVGNQQLVEKVIIK